MLFIKEKKRKEKYAKLNGGATTNMQITSHVWNLAFPHTKSFSK